MKKTISLTLLILLGFSAVIAQTTAKSSVLKPAGFTKKVTLKVSDKPSNYYSLSSEQASVVSLNGPGKLKVITRARIPSQKGSKATYQIQYVVNGGDRKMIKFTGVLQAESTVYEEYVPFVPGQGKEIEIALGRGSHTVEFQLPDATVQVDARFIFTPTKGKKMEWISYSPKAPSEPVELVSKETNVKYYRFSLQKPLKVEITGPSELRILTRIENHFNMKGRIHYRIQIKDNNMVLNTYQLNSTHSEEAVYKDNTKLIPGKACEFVIEVPKGLHVYEIYPLDEDKSTVLGRMLIPKKDVKLGQ